MSQVVLVVGRAISDSAGAEWGQQGLDARWRLGAGREERLGHLADKRLRDKGWIALCGSEQFGGPQTAGELHRLGNGGIAGRVLHAPRLWTALPAEGPTQPAFPAVGALQPAARRPQV